MKKEARKKATSTVPVTIRLPVERARLYEALAAGRLLSRSKFIELALEDRLPADEPDYSLASLCRIIAIHEEARHHELGAEFVAELSTLVSGLSRAIRQSLVE